ncbi:methylated-DNA-[protein]-cysteine S-methyltransferase [Frondihabitans sp. PhB188]|uniref:methylated-DNA--[protein]-cysteine S-methyltransferase n=1 Tax=Frondihabitans sp. PhB188 TaxID=2485200 RepID=UPI000F45FEB3|nr:methylated-DNA--[protein]-cysteine S-methyltransferase [Frondihabitans sp. PhB188]ROQ41281.1 methylated-DNA-[protein]-cysteine S-methyltransferase [Frondihabitans sp. PhB188]
MTTTFLTSSLVHHDSPVGRLAIHVAADRITRVDIQTAALIVAATETALGDTALDCTPTPLHDEARRQFDDYFANRRDRFDLPLEYWGTPFQETVWELLDEVPFGTTTTYGDLAELSGRPTGARAVGGAIRANRLAILVPCHRVLGAGRRVTGYSPGDGVATKKWLLEHEGIDFAGS